MLLTTSYEHPPYHTIAVGGVTDIPRQLLTASITPALTCLKNICVCLSG